MSDAQLISQIDAAIGAHGMWKMRLKTAITNGSSDISVHDAACDNKCQFGQWLYSDSLSPSLRAGMPYQVVKRLHAEFHQSAGFVLGDAIAGQRAGAQARLQGDFTQRSEKLVRALTKWKGEAQAGLG